MEERNKWDLCIFTAPEAKNRTWGKMAFLPPLFFRVAFGGWSLRGGGGGRLRRYHNGILTTPPFPQFLRSGVAFIRGRTGTPLTLAF